MKIATLLNSARRWIAHALVRLACAIHPRNAGASAAAQLAAPRADSSAMVAAIDRAIASGSNTVEIDGTQVNFSCTREMSAERERLVKLQSNQAAG